MSLTRLALLLVVIATGQWLAPQDAIADDALDDDADVSVEDEDDDLDGDGGEDDGDSIRRPRRGVTGLATATTFAYVERSGVATALGGSPDTGATENASPFTRVFQDLRFQLRGNRLGDRERWSFVADSRVRYTRPITGTGPDTTRPQSGFAGRSELDLNDFYVDRSGRKSRIRIGRQSVPEAAMFGVDGVRAAWRRSKNWDVVGYLGLHPARGSRSLTTDYPASVPTMTGDRSRIVPMIFGAGAAYDYGSAYGTVGLGSIVTLAKGVDGEREPVRVFVNASGYARLSNRLDIYHYLVSDFAGPSGAALNNLSLGANYRPAQSLRVSLAFNRVDGETLNVLAQRQLDDPDTQANAIVQNNVIATRVASDSGRLGLSYAFSRRRFELSTSGQLRRRPDVTVLQADGNPFTFPSSTEVDMFFGLVDRQSLWGHRIAANYLRSFTASSGQANRRSANTFRISATRALGDKGEYQVDLSYVTNSDSDKDVVCTDPLTCFGTSSSSTVALGGVLLRRLGKSATVLANATLGRQTLSVADGAMQVDQDGILIATLVFQAGYRF